MINPSPNNGENCPVKFVPRRDYVREMIRYGVLPVDHDFAASVDPFEMDKTYWENVLVRAEVRPGDNPLPYTSTNSGIIGFGITPAA